MVLEAVQIFNIAGSLAGFGALYLHYKQYKRQQPIIKCHLFKSHYELIKNSVKNIVKLRASFIVNNSGNTPTSLVNCFCFIQIQPEFTSLYGNSVVSSAILDDTNQNSLPWDIKANGTTKIDLSFSFEIDYFDALDRCMLSLNWRNTPKREYNELPLAATFIFNHTNGIFNEYGCVFRNDQPESMKVRGEVNGLLFSAVTFRRNELSKLKIG